MKAITLDEIQQPKGSNIVLPDEVKQSSATRDVVGLVVDIGPDAWKDISPRCGIGDKVRFTQFAGGVIQGDDGVIYRIVNSHAVYAVKEKVNG